MKSSTTKTIATILALAGAGLLAWAGAIWFGGSKQVGEWRAKLDEHEAKLKSTRTELHTLSLQYQAYMRSLPAVPDSVKKSSGKEMRETERRYEYGIRNLEFAERDLGLDINRSKRKLAEADQARRSRALPVAGAGVAAWLVAAITAAASRRSRKPA